MTTAALGRDDIEDIEEVNAEREVEDNRIRFSRLKLIAASPAHYREGSNFDTSAKDKGTAVHVYLSGGRVTYYPEKTKAGKSAPRNGAKWEEFRAENQDAVILSASEYDDVSRMIESIRKCDAAREALEGVREETLSFKLMNLPFRTTPDVHTDRDWTEIKTCRTSNPSRFAWESFKMKYHAQMALHRIGCKRAVKGFTPRTGWMVVVESSRPFPVTVFKVTEKALEIGEKQVRMWAETLKGCMASNQWPPYAQSVLDLDVPEEDLTIGSAGLLDATDEVKEW
jgi:hypothetical protein